MKITNLLNTENLSGIDSKEQFAMDILTGLCSKPKHIASKYFYDDIGSQLFQKITQQEDYYPTRTEHSILQEAQGSLAGVVNEKEIDIIELGAGDGHKTKIIIDGFLQNKCLVNFYPIDISAEAMDLLKVNLQEGNGLSIHGVVAEYFEGLKYVREHSKNKLLVLFLGSNIGNFDKASCHKFLRMLWTRLEHDDFLFTGFDLKKDIRKLTNAYNDKAGHTTAFNLNLLNRINNELGADFKIDQFQHFGSYNPLLGAMESYLVSTVAQYVYVEELQRTFHFKAFEPIHLEYSFKFLPEDIEKLANETGYEKIQNFTDAKEYFIDSLWQVKKESKAKN